MGYAARMARNLRIQYHEVNRGDRREDIFQSDNDPRLFLEILGQSCGRTDWQEQKAVTCKNIMF